MEIRLGLFVLATVLLAWFSRASLLRPQTHGFYRFFVFEVIVALTLLNAGHWLQDPFSWHQAISWILLTGSVVPLLLGVRALHAHGGTGAPTRNEPGLQHFERTARVVTVGIFRYIRHPMYASLLLLTWGLFFKNPSVLGAALAVLATALLIRMAIIEEGECLQVFGQDYRQYMLRTKRFVPYLF